MKATTHTTRFYFFAFAILSLFAPRLKAAPENKFASSQKQFATPQEAVDNLVQAAESFDVNALKEILGPGSDDLITTEDSVADKKRATDFVAKVKEKSVLEPEPKNSNRIILTIGNDSFPAPVPLVRSNGKWHFDARAGRDEILRRRVGANELNAIEVCRGFVEAQKEYAEDKHDDSKVNQYAQKIVSSEGKQDGLAWKTADGKWGGPIGETVANALAEGYSDKSKPFHGYYFKVLRGQGPAAPMGQMDFVVNDTMIGGFALAAAPAQYRVTGVKSFIVSHDGIVYEKDLGPKTLAAFASMERFNPDKSWQAVEEQSDSDGD